MTPHKADVAYRFTPYAAGEPLRPEARIDATPTEGIPPMTVALKARETRTVTVIAGSKLK